MMVLPGLQRLQTYRPEWWRGDVVAGLTVAAYLIPQCMAYGELAGVEPVAGLWGILPAMLIYALLGSSPQLSVGPESTTAVMTAAAITPLSVQTGQEPAELAAVLAVMVGVLCAIAYIARLGFVANLLSKPILVGYMAGVAVLMIAGQLGKVGGFSLQSETVYGEVWEFFAHITALHLPTLFLATLVLVFLLVFQHRYPTAPGALLAVLLATGVTALFHLNQQGVMVVGQIPAGLPRLILPSLEPSLAMSLLAIAAGIAIVGYSDNVLTARAFAARNGYRININQELLALGIANIGAGLTQGFPLSSSGSRTVLGDASGSQSQVFSLVAFAVVVAVLLFLRPVLALFPLSALGAIVIFAALRLIEVSEFVRLWRFRKSEFLLAIATTIGVLATDILIGVGVAVVLSILDLLIRVARPHDAVLGRVQGLEGWHDIEDWEQVETVPGLLIYRYDAPLCFANADDFKQRAWSAIQELQFGEAGEMVKWFVLNAESISEIDVTAFDMLNEFHAELASNGIHFCMAKVKQDLYVQLQRSGLLARMGADGVFPTISSAVSAHSSLKRD
ncbi:MAG: SulP family inorganic anion transporter [Synechococcus sp.]